MNNRRVDNRGAAIVMVLVAIAFLTLLGSTLLFTTYTGYQMKIAERRATQTFYDAETAMNELRLGVQHVASESIATAYARVLANYNAAVESAEESAHTNKFEEYFIEAFAKWEADLGPGAGTPLLSLRPEAPNADNHSYDCDPDVLQSFLSRGESDGVKLETSGEAEYIAADRAFYLRGLTVTYTEGGYTSTVHSDVRISLPRFSYTVSELILRALPNFTVIANSALDCGLYRYNIDGNAYAGSINVAQNNSSLNIANGKLFICKGEVTVANSARFTSPAGTALWAGGITVGNNAALDLAGETYVLDDLTLRGSSLSGVGSGVDVTLSGAYYGFGNATGFDGTTANPERSSAILINGQGNKLNMSGLNTLMLAGNSFIIPHEGVASGVLMGESLSVRSNQLAYLVPAECLIRNPANRPASEPVIQGSNPGLYPTASTPQLSNPASWGWNNYVDLNAVVFTDASGRERTLDEYITGIQPVYYPLANSGQTLLYFYMRFADADAASDYFRDYFAVHQDEMSDYISLYADLISLPNAASAAGGLISFDEDGAEALSPVSVSSLAAARFSQQFSNLCATLTKTVGGVDDNASVYQYIVDTNVIGHHIPENTSLLFYNESGVLVGLIVNGSFSLNNSDTHFQNLKVIIATGDVTVNRSFTGLVISGATVHLNSDLYADTTDPFLQADSISVPAALSAICSIKGDDGDNLTMLDFLQNVSANANSVSSGGGLGAGTWEMEELVTCENWSRQ